ncbi:MAG TPA: hypothetical protein VGW12_04420 [Pyrinomonadaceae bacterium]|nr:hypothetical protein [Pyrinomonadaceae bacterium]
MNRLAILIFVALLLPSAVLAQRNAPGTPAELAEITARGRQLAEYDVAAWHATDAVVALSPPEGSVARYLARKTDAGWVVVFGRFNEKRDKFLIAYEATQDGSPTKFKVNKHEPPKETTDFFFYAAKAVDTALKDFRGEQRPYNVAVLPAKSEQLYVYVMPAQTKHGIYPHGGDARYLISQDGTKFLEKRRMHNSILEFVTEQNNDELAAGFHTAVVDDIPEDTDVFYVLARRPAVPEWIGTRKYVYKVEVDGTIKYVSTMEAFMKKK